MVLVVIFTVVNASVFVKFVVGVVVNTVIVEGVPLVARDISDVVDSVVVVIGVVGVVFREVVLTEISVIVVIAGGIVVSVVVIVIAVVGGTNVEDTRVLTVVIMAFVIVVE